MPSNHPISMPSSSRKRKGPWYCYMLRGAGVAGQDYTYVGKTNHMKRRLRQHNHQTATGKTSRSKKGAGARYTRRHRPHRPFVIVGGFPSERAVLQFEWAMKHRRKPGSRGRRGRIQTLERLLVMERWTQTAPWMAHLRLVVRTSLSRAQYVAMLLTSHSNGKGIARALVRNTCNVSYVFDQTPNQLVMACSPHPPRASIGSPSNDGDRRVRPTMP